jgi:O-antigen/teichoic acid export membrane protein
MIIRENIRKTFLYAYVTSLLAQVCELGLNILVFGQFSVGDVGTYGLIMSIVTFFSFAVDMGLNQNLIREFSQQRLTFPEALLGSTVLRLPVACLGIIIIFTWIFYHSPSTLTQEWLPLTLAICTSILLTQRTLATSWLRAHDQQTRANIIGFLYPAGKLAGGLLLIKLQKFHLAYFFGAILLVEVLLTTLSYWCTGKVKLGRLAAPSVSLDFLKRSALVIWKPGMIFFLIGLCVVLQNRLDWMLVYAYVSKTELAYYSLANKIYELFNSYIGIAATTLFPWLCKVVQTDDNNQMLVVGAKFLTFISILIGGIVALCSPIILQLLWGNKYAATYPLVFVVMCSALLSPICAITYYFLVAHGYEKFILVTAIGSTIIQTIMNLLLIPKLGALGAALGMNILNITNIIIFIFILIKLKLFNNIAFQKNLIYSFMSICILLVLKWQVSNNILLLTAYTIMAVLLGLIVLFTKSDLLYILHILHGLKPPVIQSH